jgi:hypothetical protein
VLTTCCVQCRPKEHHTGLRCCTTSCSTPWTSKKTCHNALTNFGWVEGNHILTTSDVYNFPSHLLILTPSTPIFSIYTQPHVNQIGLLGEHVATCSYNVSIFFVNISMFCTILEPTFTQDHSCSRCWFMHLVLILVSCAWVVLSHFPCRRLFISWVHRCWMTLPLLCPIISHASTGQKWPFQHSS